jgi:phage terminase small subunit
VALSAKRARFVEEYLVDLNATQAAIRAGYSPGKGTRSAEVQAERLLRNAEVRAAIAEAKEARSIRTRITQDQVLQELARLGFADVRKVASWDKTSLSLKVSSDLDDDAAAAVAEVAMTEHGPKIKLHDKLGALTKLGNHLGLFKEKVEVTGKDGGPIEVSDAHARLAELVDRAARGATRRGDSTPDA